MIVHDYPAKVRRTFEDIESLALYFRAKWGIASALQIDVFALLFSNMPDALKATGLTMVPRPPGFMGERDAYAAPNSKRIFYRDRLLAQLRFGHPNASLIFLHELAHFLLHPGAEKAWVTSGNQRPVFIADENSTEWQATTFALCLMAPRQLANDCKSAIELAEKFGLDAAHAERHFEMLARRRPRKIPDSYLKLKSDLQRKAHSASVYVEELCPECGLKQLIQIDNKYRCANCGRAGVHFQDGDLVD